MRDMPRPSWAGDLLGCLLVLLGVAWLTATALAALAGSWMVSAGVFLSPFALTGFGLLLGELWQATAVRWYHADPFTADVERFAAAAAQHGPALRALDARARCADLPTPDPAAFAALMRDAGAGSLEEL